MARKKNINQSGKLLIRPTPGIIKYLEDVVRLETMGKAVQDVIERFVGDRIEQLIQEEKISRRQWPDEGLGPDSNGETAVSP